MKAVKKKFRWSEFFWVTWFSVFLGSDLADIVLGYATPGTYLGAFLMAFCILMNL